MFIAEVYPVQMYWCKWAATLVDGGIRYKSTAYKCIGLEEWPEHNITRKFTLLRRINTRTEQQQNNRKKLT